VYLCHRLLIIDLRWSNQIKTKKIVLFSLLFLPTPEFIPNMHKKYTRQDLIDAVKTNLDSKSALIKCNIPAGTIPEHRREPCITVRMGRLSYFTSDQATHFVSLLELLPRYGFDLAGDPALQLAAEYCQCHPDRYAEDLIWKKPEKLARIRAGGFTEKSPSAWLETLEDTLTNRNLFDKTNQIFNAVQSDFSDETKSQ
jgi:hypothetical protein